MPRAAGTRPATTWSAPVTDHDVPEYARAALRRITDQLDELRTQRIRLRAAGEELAARLPARPRPDPAEKLRAAAQNRDTPVELIRVARAVREGRTSWQEIVDGQASSVPEVAAFQEHMNRELARFIDSGALRDLLPTRQDGPPPDTAHERPTSPTRDEDGDEIEVRWVRR